MDDVKTKLEGILTKVIQDKYTDHLIFDNNHSGKLIQDIGIAEKEYTSKVVQSIIETSVTLQSEQKFDKGLSLLEYGAQVAKQYPEIWRTTQIEIGTLYLREAETYIKDKKIVEAVGLMKESTAYYKNAVPMEKWKADAFNKRFSKIRIHWEESEYYAYQMLSDTQKYVNAARNYLDEQNIKEANDNMKAAHQSYRDADIAFARNASKFLDFKTFEYNINHVKEELSTVSEKVLNAQKSHIVDN